MVQMIQYGFYVLAKNPALTKVPCAFPMVISSDFRVGQHRDDDHEEDAPYFISFSKPSTKSQPAHIRIHCI